MFLDLVKIGNWAKDIGDYDLTNEIFAVALMKYFDLSETERNDTEGGPPPACLILETQDVAGDYMPEVYYDLLVVEAYQYHEEGGGYTIHDLCIPVPLLSLYAIATAMKFVTVVEREQHGREIREADEDEARKIRAELLGLAALDFVEACKANVLCECESEEI